METTTTTAAAARAVVGGFPPPPPLFSSRRLAWALGDLFHAYLGTIHATPASWARTHHLSAHDAQAICSAQPVRPDAVVEVLVALNWAPSDVLATTAGIRRLRLPRARPHHAD